MENKHLVEFERWCPLCKWKDAKDIPDPKIPCDECLEVPARENSTIPDRYDGPLPTKKKDKDGHWVIDDPSLKEAGRGK